MKQCTSQGLTAEYAVVFGSGFDQKSIYVAHSRARERVDTYVPSKEAFLLRAQRDQGDRLGALEAIAKAGKAKTLTRDLLNRPPGYRRTDITPEKNFAGRSVAKNERQKGTLALKPASILQCTPIQKGDFMTEQEFLTGGDKGKSRQKEENISRSLTGTVSRLDIAELSGIRNKNFGISALEAIERVWQNGCQRMLLGRSQRVIRAKNSQQCCATSART